MAEKMKFDFCGSVCYNKEYRAVAIFWCRHKRGHRACNKRRELDSFKENIDLKGGSYDE